MSNETSNWTLGLISPLGLNLIKVRFDRSNVHRPNNLPVNGYLIFLSRWRTSVRYGNPRGLKPPLVRMDHDERGGMLPAAKRPRESRLFPGAEFSQREAVAVCMLVDTPLQSAASLIRSSGLK